ncbi:MAG: hypothetical protein ABIF08_02505 [Nanoarchaeota archaeon]
MSDRKILIMCLTFALFSSFLISQTAQAANYGYTTAYFYIPTDTSFSVTILGQSDTNITSEQSGTPNQTSSWIAFNATTLTQDDVNAQAKPGDDSNLQTGLGKPIFVFANTGTIGINISLSWSGSGNAGPDSCVTVRMNSTCFPSGGCVGAYELEQEEQISTTAKVMVANLSVGSKLNATLIANLSSCELGTFDSIADLSYESGQE